MSAATSFAVTMVHICNCIHCGLPVLAPSSLESEIRNRAKTFYCCNGHEMAYRESEADRLKARLAQAERERDGARARAEMADRSAAAHKGKLTELKNRIHNGVCPCCKRSFQNLRRHMSTKHPDFKESP